MVLIYDRLNCDANKHQPPSLSHLLWRIVGQRNIIGTTGLWIARHSVPWNKARLSSESPKGQSVNYSNASD